MYHSKSESAAERRIIERAAAVLAEGRGRTMQEIAEISGIGRTTLYRHFRTREDLIQAIKDQAYAEAREAISAARPDEGEPEEALRRVIAGLVAAGTRYGVLLDEGVPGEEEMREQADPELVLQRLVERGQREGAFTSTLSPRWILTAMRALIVAAIEHVREGELARNYAATTVADTLLIGISARERA